LHGAGEWSWEPARAGSRGWGRGAERAGARRGRPGCREGPGTGRAGSGCRGGPGTGRVGAGCRGAGPGRPRGPGRPGDPGWREPVSMTSPSDRRLMPRPGPSCGPRRRGLITRCHLMAMPGNRKETGLGRPGRWAGPGYYGHELRVSVRPRGPEERAEIWRGRQPRARRPELPRLDHVYRAYRLGRAPVARAANSVVGPTLLIERQLRSNHVVQNASEIKMILLEASAEGGERSWAGARGRRAPNGPMPVGEVPWGGASCRTGRCAWAGARGGWVG
jgi:hypothetical protein